ncbi:type I polyketide synthase [Micromonospora sp. NPDC018662]|uniref:type I polyketide synthase n=1 Tax=Micromonospora sp. NPDC018662 TaxID=3364238 RepID=UPI0037B30814
MTRDRSLDVAVTGLAARFPGPVDLADWWSALVDGEVLTTRLDRDELLAAGVPTRLVDDPAYVPVRGHLDRAEHFDTTLFQVSPREAELMDPQHRLMLETAWRALEDAGVAPRDGGTRTGVFASATGSGYLRAMIARGVTDPVTVDDLVHGTEPDFMASRVAYKLGLTGPAVAVQSACSSSLVAVHTAIQHLLGGDCDQALVVATGFDFPQAGHLHLAGGVQSASGDCRPFDRDADGVVGGSGVAAVVLRRLADALDDGAEPYGVILGSAVNNDGAAKAGYYAPSQTGQERVIEAALRAADVPAASIGYLETHGTGTRVGDPIEWAAACAALRRGGARPGQVPVGALKANIGHLDAAAGVAALIKALLVVGRGTVPPVAGFTRPNPLLAGADAPLRVPTRAEPWTGPRPRRAGVSAFGIGGTNAHLVVEEAPPSRPRTAGPPGVRLAVLSAAEPEALARAAERLAARLAADAPDLADVCHTLATGRAALPERLAVAGRTPAEVAARLRAGTGVARGRVPAAGCAPLAFLFPGQGTQFPGMGVGYADALPGFGAALDHCLDAFAAPLAATVRRALLDAAFPADELDETALAQPALFALGYAAATALRALGLHPAVVAGHSLGEITAACVAGVLDLSAAAALVTERGRAMQDCPPGAMLALGCGADEARALLATGPPLDLAAVNGPESCVVAGEEAAIDALRTRVGERLPTRRLRTRRAFHSRLVDPAVPRLAAALRAVTTRPSVVAVASTVDGRIVPAGTAPPAAVFADQARRTVRFDAAMASVAEAVPRALVVEIGPGRALSAMAEAAGLPTLALHDPGAADAATGVLAALGALWTVGQPVPATAWCPTGRPVRLPGYPFAGPRWLAAELTAPTAPTAPTPGGTADADAGATAPPDPSALMRAAWAALLGHHDLAPESDFFHLGGDSLLVTRLARTVNAELGIRVPIRDLLASRTLGRQTQLVRRLVDDGRAG